MFDRHGAYTEYELDQDMASYILGLGNANSLFKADRRGEMSHGRINSVGHAHTEVKK